MNLIVRFCFTLAVLSTLFAGSQTVIAGCFDTQANRPFYEIGIAQSQSGIKVHHASGETSYEPIGLIESDNEYTLHLAVGSPYQYFDIFEGKIGYYCRAGYGSYELYDQPNFNDPRESDHSLSGYYFFAHPVIFLNFGDPYIKPGNISAKIGVGVGLGYLKASGKLLIDNRGSIEEKNVRIEEFNITYEFFVEGRIGNWFMRQVYFGPEVEKDDLIYTFVGSSLQLGYTVEF